ncbi:hypothetical protein TNIN_481181 [Trichonephila inaurata madagascariensis]|uniref:Uncharacterized protein n=1 Tax=Trichonephila inaurata madagascariensis TaxID=2747483 RepID=A0A8X6XLS0_9ARAC|nr:hypothetical protein TNIN_481181 [Trichonephila inaurata madagascariensis]
MKKKVPTEVHEHFIDEWAKIKTPKVLVEKLDEYEDVHGKTRRLAVPFINKEKSYRNTPPLNTRSSLPQLEERDVRNKERRQIADTITISMTTVIKRIIIKPVLRLDNALVEKKIILQEHAEIKV